MKSKPGRMSNRYLNLSALAMSVAMCDGWFVHHSPVLGAIVFFGACVLAGCTTVSAYHAGRIDRMREDVRR